MQHGYFREAGSRSAIQEVLRILWNPKVHCRAHKSPPPVPIQSQMNPIRTFTYYLKSILILSSHLRQGLPSSLFPSGVPPKLYTFLVFSMRATRLANLIILRLHHPNRTFDKKYKFWSSSHRQKCHEFRKKSLERRRRIRENNIKMNL
jgi:hypothetical protein